MLLSSRRNIYKKTCRSVSDHNINPSSPSNTHSQITHKHSFMGEAGWSRLKEVKLEVSASRWYSNRVSLNKRRKSLTFPSSPINVSSLFRFFTSAQKRVFHRICCLSIIFFPFPSFRAAMEMAFYLFTTLESVSIRLFHLLSNGKLFLCPCRGWKIYYSDFLWAFVVYGFRIGRPHYFPLCSRHGWKKKSIGILFVYFSCVCFVFTI